MSFLEIATDYFKEDRYPNPCYNLPQREEIEKVLLFTYYLFETTCAHLDINPDDAKS
jgi:hypothetical protein